MKKNRILGLASAIALLAAGACSNEMIDPNKNQGGLLNTDDSSGGVYMTVDFQLPDADGTRSSTTEDGGSDDGTEVGFETENNVTSALIVLAFDKTDGIINMPETKIEKYGYIVAGEVQNNHISHVGDNSTLFEATAKLNKNNLNNFYGMFYDDETSTYNVPEVYVFVFCNPTQELKALFATADDTGATLKFGSASWVDATCTVIQNDAIGGQSDKNIGIWSPNSFLMNSKSLTTRALPTKLLDWENFSSYDKAFHLSDVNNQVTGIDVIDNSADKGRGAVLVERSVARFDFKDGSDYHNNSYNVLFAMNALGDIDNKAPIVGVQLQKMCLVNMGNKFYYLPRVSDDGQINGTGYELCGKEKKWSRDPSSGIYTKGNYVVGPYADVFKTAAASFGYEDAENDSQNPTLGNSILSLNGKPLTSYFNFPFFDKSGSFNQDLTLGNQWDVVKIDDIINNGNKDNLNQQYNVWRYVTENVIPSIEDQVNGISTGVIFKGKIIAGIDTPSDLSDYEEFWNEGYIQNLQNCLNGKEFTYNGTTHTLQGNSKSDPILYYFNGRLYMGWRHLLQAAIQESVTMNVSGALEINRNTSLYQAVFGDGPIPPYYETTNDNGAVVKKNLVYYYLSNGKKEEKAIEDPKWLESFNPDGSTDTNDGDYLNYKKSANYAWIKWSKGGKSETIDEDETKVVNPDLTAMREAVTGAGITIYQSSTDSDYNEAGYYCYYYYWNRHNDNNMNGSMGPMEFDVVRNNVYKLSVDKISRLGHPRIPGNDPNPPTPDTPDESDDIYLDVQVQIAPWVVRYNSIIF